MYTQALEGFSVGTQRICVIFTFGQPVLLLFKKREREKKKKKKEKKKGGGGGGTTKIIMKRVHTGAGKFQCGDTKSLCNLYFGSARASFV